jgi:hypothetical protein
MSEDYFIDEEYPPLSPPSGKPFRLLNKYNGDLNFTDLLDTFSDYLGKGGKFLIVKTDESGIGVSSIDIKSDKNFVHIQVTDSATWTITHDLQKQPSVNVVDADGFTALVDINRISDNELQIISSIPFSGIAYLN